MTDRAGSHVRTWNLIGILVAAWTILVATLVAVPLPARAGPCDQVGGVITGDWTVSTAQTCTGILYTVDGSVAINAGGSLTLKDGGLRFAKDAAHAGYSLTINAGGELILDNSVVTVETDAIDPYLRLVLTVTGAGSQFTMVNGASLKFPGWFNATGATLDLTDSTITGFTSAEIAGLGLYQDDHDDGPVINWASTTASLYNSRIERIYENTSAASDPNATGIISADLTLRTGTNLYAYDSHLGVDFSYIRGLHNELQVDGTSNAYLYGVTIDRTQDPVVKTDWQPAFVPAAGGSVYLHRWLRVTAVDSTAFPVSGALVASTLSPSATTAQYPDNGMSTTPSARTLAYLGRTAVGATAWNRTDANGLAVIPLYTDQITTASLPNAESFGNYQEVVTFSGRTVTTGANFPGYPAIATADNTVDLTVPFPDLTVRTGPDLALFQTDYPGTVSAVQGQSFTIDALIHNQGQTTATGVSIAAYLDGNRGTEVARVNGLTVAVAATVTQTLTVSGIGTLGPHTLMLIADPDNGINEGGVAQEGNNFANVTLNVLPPPNGFVAILAPSPGQAVDAGTTLSVTGYVRDENATGLVGVPLRIELRSGTSVLVTNLTTTQSLGFFMGAIPIADTTADGSYSIVVTATSGPIQADTRAITVKHSVSLLNTPILGLPIWLWLIIVVGAAAAIGGGTAYMKYVGVGKLVECGECGSYIPGDSPKCPKCGVEFEKGMAKCSNCQTWIPMAVKECPECGVEFATGEVEMADYEAQMKAQYEQVRQKFREDASREIGRSLTDREFADWWRMQPTFVTFEDWLREEEEMRRMGSKPCPVCQTLNSVTATVCHKCGTLLKTDARRAPAGGRPPARTRPATPVDAAEGDAVERPTQPVPPKAAKTPAMGPVVQKKVITAPPEPKKDEASDAEKKSDDDAI